MMHALYDLENGCSSARLRTEFFELAIPVVRAGKLISRGDLERRRRNT